MQPPQSHHHHHCLSSSSPHPPRHVHHLPLFFVCPCRCRPLLSFHHHRHHFSPSPHLHCPNCRPIPPNDSASRPLPAGCSAPVRPEGFESSEPSGGKDTAVSTSGFQQQEWGEDVEFDEEEAEEEEEGVLVLTDEWKEFFAKSEAKRRLDKQQKKKGSR